MEIIKSLSQNLITVLIIIFGAIVHATVQFKLAREKKDDKFTFVDFIILIPTSAFAGWIFGLIASIYFNNESIILLISGIGAFLGVAGINKISNAILDVLINRIKK